MWLETKAICAISGAWVAVHDLLTHMDGRRVPVDIIQVELGHFDTGDRFGGEQARQLSARVVRAAARRVLLASDEILNKCIDLGGSVTGEHGIGDCRTDRW